LGADIINISQGCIPTPKSACSELEDSIQKLAMGGVMIVAASGELQFGTEINAMPALSGGVLTVGGVASTGLRTATSPVGPAQGLCKPDVVALDPVDPLPMTDQYVCSNAAGSSFDAPFVSVLVARLWLEVPLLKGHVADTIRVLKEASDGIPSPPLQPGAAPNSYLCPKPAGTPKNQPPPVIPNREFGYGILNLTNYTKAVEKAKALTATPP
jgi:hypothetical protein